MTDPQERFWENLLDLVEGGRVIPVIGPELVTLRENGVDLPIDRWIALHLIQDLGLPACGLPERLTLNDVVSHYVSSGGEREEIYPRIFRIMRNVKPGPDHLLNDIASITPFNLYISLTCDSLLEQAIAASRGEASTNSVSYAPNAVKDIPCPRERFTRPYVFHLLGSATCAPEFVICEEDLLEFIHALQDRQLQPELLFDELRRNHLLILGCGFKDWVTRFFLRTARSVELSQKRRHWEILVDEQVDRDVGLTVFLRNFSHDTRILPMSAGAFVRELTKRWHTAHPPLEINASPLVAGSPGRPIPQGAVFISYASENVSAAQRIADGLRAAHLDVWFDRSALLAGDHWADEIHRGVERCSLFLPVISRESISESNRRRYFWREWNEAHEIARGMAASEEFIIPIVIDDTRMDASDSLPESFRRAQALRAIDGKISAEFATLIIELVRDFHRRQQAA